MTQTKLYNAANAKHICMCASGYRSTRSYIENRVRKALSASCVKHGCGPGMTTVQAWLYAIFGAILMAHFIPIMVHTVLCQYIYLPFLAHLCTQLPIETPVPFEPNMAQNSSQLFWLM